MAEESRGAERPNARRMALGTRRRPFAGLCSRRTMIHHARVADELETEDDGREDDVRGAQIYELDEETLAELRAAFPAAVGAAGPRLAGAPLKYGDLKKAVRDGTQFS